jgi:Uma2 family endonuclease
MAPAAQPLLITVDQYRLLPDREDVIEELHWGMLVTLTRPKMKHAKLRSRLVRLLRPLAEHLGVVEPEVAFRALPEYDLRAADVAFVSQVRWDSTSGEDNLRGSPELVIEVLSPSNKRREMQEKAALCLSTGTEEFWAVDPKRNTVSVTRLDSSSHVYMHGDRIPLAMFGATEVEVAAVFRH